MAEFAVWTPYLQPDEQPAAWEAAQAVLPDWLDADGRKLIQRHVSSRDVFIPSMGPGGVRVVGEMRIAYFVKGVENALRALLQSRRFRSAGVFAGPEGPGSPVAVMPVPATGTLERKLYDLYTAKVRTASATFRSALNGVPWPHRWMREITLPWAPVQAGGFQGTVIGPEFIGYSGPARVWDYFSLYTSGYFERPKALMERDLARWIQANTAPLAEMFQYRVKRWVAQKEGEALTGVIPALMSLVRGVLFLAGMASTFFIPAAYQLVVTAVTGGWKFVEILRAKGQEEEFREAAAKVLGIPPEAWDAFADWIAEKSTPAVPMLVVRVEGREVGRSRFVDEAAALAIRYSSTGDRVEIAQPETDRSLWYVRTAEALDPVSPEQEARVRAAPAKKKPFPWWLLIPILVK